MVKYVRTSNRINTASNFSSSISNAATAYNSRRMREVMEAQATAQGIETASMRRDRERLERRRQRVEAAQAAAARRVARRREIALANPRSLRTAYLWWALSVFGLFGGHYFYMGLPGRGVACIFTAGFFTFTMWADPFRMGNLVQRVNAGQL